MVVASAQTELDATDENAYLRSIDVSLFRAETRITEGYSLKLFRVNGNNSLSELTAGENEVVSISPTAIVLDLRLVTKSDYVIKAVITGSRRIPPQVQFSVNRIYQDYVCRPTNGTSINPSDVQRYDAAMVDSEGLVVDCPANIIRIGWRTDSAHMTGVQHNEGGTTLFSLSRTGIGINYDDDWLDVYTMTDIKPQHKIATDEDGNILVDEHGNKLIFN